LFNETIGLEYALDAAKLREGIGLIAEALAQNEHIAPEPRRATLRYFATDSLAIETFAYIMTADFDESLRIRNDLMLDIYERLEQAGIGFAFPTQTLYLRKDETGQG
ncbi:MAG TPA: mechanosensitive ion channel family protein, partial [Erythrobacter sp.]|nr:mechanosensitive ion channel family protein [Erythrobacter sp.]